MIWMKRRIFQSMLSVLALISAVFFFSENAYSSNGDSVNKYPEVSLKYTQGEVTDTTIEYGGLPRRFLYYVPNNFDKNAKHPVVMILHGWNQPIEAVFMAYATMRSKADKDGTLLIYPIATGESEKETLAWNTKYGTYANTKMPDVDSVDDVGFLAYLFDLFVGNLSGDPDRLYATGISLGGAMTYTLSCYIPDRLAAVAPVVMQIGPKFIKEFANAKPLPIMIFTGSADPLVSGAGNIGEPESEMLPFSSVDDNLFYWKARNEISNDPVVTALANPVTEIFKGKESPSHIVKFRWKGPNGNDLIWYNVINGGHWLPIYEGGRALDSSNLDGFDGSYMGNYNCDFDASGAIYDFLIQFTRR